MAEQGGIDRRVELRQRVGAQLPSIELQGGGDAWQLGEFHAAAAAIVTPGFFSAMGVPLVKGRDISDRDTASAPSVVVVNQAFARKFFPGEEAIGRQVQTGKGPGAVVREIAGVVGDAKQAADGADSDPIFYFPSQQLSWGVDTVVLRTAGPPQPGEQLAAGVIAAMQFSIVLMGGFAAVALLLTVTGLYPALHTEVIDWFLTLPLWLDLPELRVVHACWHDPFLAWLAHRNCMEAATSPGN